MAIISSDYNKQIPWGLHGSTVPVWVSSTSVSIASMAERSWDNTVDMIKTTSTTVSTTTTGAGGILTSANLAGTVTISASSTTVTGTGTSFTTNFVVGDVINIYNGSIWQPLAIASITSNTQLTTQTAITTGVTNGSYQRGGAAPSAIYYLYAISYFNGSNATFALSGRSVGTGDTMVDLPSSYTKYRQLPASFVTNTSGNIFEFYITGWPISPMYILPTQLIFSGNAPTTATVLSCSAYVPKNAKSVIFNAWNYAAASSMYYLADNFAYANSGQLAIYSLDSACYLAVPCTVNQSIQHYASAASTAIDLYVRGYIATESV
jgi:hypothetical protein